MAAIESTSRRSRFRGRRRGWLSGTAVLIAGGIAIAIAVTTAGPSPANGTDLTTAELYQAPTRAAANTAMLDYFLPANGTQFAAGQEYMEYTTVAKDAVTNQCLTNKGLASLPVHPLAYSGDNEEFPDISYLEENGFVTESTTPAASATAGTSPSSASPPEQAVSQCTQTASGALSQVVTEGSSLETSWMQAVAKIDETTAVKSALAGFSTCVASTGVQAATVTAFFATTTSKVRAPGADLLTAERSLGQLYARCIQPVEAVRDAARATARATFIRSHALAVDGLESSWSSALSTLESAGTAWPTS